MDVFGKDLVIGDFKLSDYGLILASWDYARTDIEDLGIAIDTIEDFIAGSPVPIFLGEKYKNKLMPQVTLIKDPAVSSFMYFTEHECREVLRQLTGFNGYKNMQIYSYELDELLYYHVRVINASYKKIDGKVAGIKLQMECDSLFAWSKQYDLKYDVKAGDTIYIYNSSDDLYHYLLPKVTIIPKAPIDKLEMINLSDKNWTTIIKNIGSQEIITMDSQNDILWSSHTERIFASDFNLHFIRLVAGENRIQTNRDITITFTFRLPRKIGFVTA